MFIEKFSYLEYIKFAIAFGSLNLITEISLGSYMSHQKWKFKVTETV